ncbi:MAG TPA: hypothetical protein VKZ79_03495 [Alphaproteobacteria bacterium]|nr:hypothetical protein [Alphaproteobacteria bacterium]
MVLVIALGLSAILLRILALPYESHDWIVYLQDWYSHFLTHGRFHSLADQFSNYPPPYLYLISFISLFDGLAPALVLIKLTSITFDALCSIFMFKIVFNTTREKIKATILALAFLNLPTVILNGSFWGQCDIIYVSMLLLTIYSILVGRQYLAMSAFGIALSFKLQSIFFVPILLYLIYRGAIRIRALPLIPIVYVFLLLPAAIAGRPWQQLVGIYHGQVTANEPIVMSAPNLLLFVNKIIPHIPFDVGMAIGLSSAIFATCLFLISALRRNLLDSPAYLICASALCLALEPYFLPKMHDRYFFGADIFAFALFAIKPQTWVLPTLFQIASGLAYVAYFASYDAHLMAIAGPCRYLGALTMTVALLALAREYLRIPPKPGAWRLQLAM